MNLFLKNKTRQSPKVVLLHVALNYKRHRVRVYGYVMYFLGRLVLFHVLGWHLTSCTRLIYCAYITPFSKQRIPTGCWQRHARSSFTGSLVTTHMTNHACTLQNKTAIFWYENSDVSTLFFIQTLFPRWFSCFLPQNPLEYRAFQAHHFVHHIVLHRYNQKVLCTWYSIAKLYQDRSPKKGSVYTQYNHIVPVMKYQFHPVPTAHEGDGAQVPRSVWLVWVHTGLIWC